MTQKEIAIRIIKNGTCKGILCKSDGCPLYDMSCGKGTIEPVALWAKEWLQSNGGTMNKSEALSRLDSIEKEQAELRKIIEKGDNILYEKGKTYIGIHGGMPFILAGDDSCDYFRFHSLYGAEQGYTSYRDTGQECLDYHARCAFDIHVFDDTKEALQFFIDHL